VPFFSSWKYFPSKANWWSSSRLVVISSPRSQAVTRYRPGSISGSWRMRILGAEPP
jgi:hypothetical protein